MMNRTRVLVWVLAGACTSALVSTSSGITIATNMIGVSMELDREVRQAHQTQKAVIKVGLKGNDFDKALGRAPVNLSIALDRSGSMTEAKLAKVKEAAVAAVRKLSAEDIFSLVVYAQNVDTIVPAQHVTNVDDIVARINAIGPTKGNTSLFGGISIAAHEIRANPDRKYVRRIILMSDGKANAGPSGVDDMGRLAHALKKENISVTTIGVGNDYNEDLMTILASKSNGNTYYVQTTDDLPRIFTAELGDMLSVVAKNVNLSINCPAGVVPTGILNWDGKIQGQQITLGLNQLYGGQEKYALVEVMIPQSQATGALEVANAVVSYDNAFTLTNEVSFNNAVQRFSQKPDEVALSGNGTVQRDYYYNVKAMAQNKAIELADEGKILQAAEELRRNGTMLRWNGAQNNDTQLIQAADEMEKQADQIGQKGISPQARKALRADSFQIQSSQWSK